MDVSREYIDKIVKMANDARIKGRKLGMRAYHTSAEINYNKEIFCQERKTPAGSYNSFEPISGHKSDTLLRLISENSDPGDTIYDIGAYSGTYSLSLANEYPERVVVAFEPDRVTRSRLKKNIKETEPKGELMIRPFGVGDEVGYRTFYRSSFRKISSFNKEDATRWGADIIEEQVTQVMTIDELSRLLPEPDHIKVDAEGFAPRVLRGSESIIKSRSPVFYIEPHDRKGADRTGEIHEWCSDNNYIMETENEAIVCKPRD